MTVMSIMVGVSFADKKQEETMKSLNKTSLIAPCGMNCGICMAYLREQKKCPGCHGSNKDKPVYCVKCRIKNCEIIKNNQTIYLIY